MATNSMTYVKRFLTSIGAEKDAESTSAYYGIEGLKIRLSNHLKKTVKDAAKHDINIVSPVNDTKQYIVLVENSLAVMVFDLKGLKDFVNNYILVRRMYGFIATEKEKEEEPLPHGGTLSGTMEVKGMGSCLLGDYLNFKYGELYCRMSTNARAYLRTALAKNFKTIAEMDEYLTNEFKEKLSVSKKMGINKGMLMKIFK